jgi:hypothetical protein
LLEGKRKKKKKKKNIYTYIYIGENVIRLESAVLKCPGLPWSRKSIP